MHPSLRTAICDSLEIDFPILQAGMGYVARAELAAAVSESGALGMLGASTMTPEELREQIREVRKRTARPFGVDILFAKSPRREDGKLAYTGAVNAQIEVVFEERVPVLVSGLGDPGPCVAEAHDLGIQVLALTGNTKNALRLEASGVDAVIAQGYEGGGHTGRVGTMSLLPAVLDAVSVPVLAAGGLADGRGLAAVIAMGGLGAWMGTRFVATREAWGHDAYKNGIVRADDEGTIRTRCFSGKPARMLRNKPTEAWEAPELAATIQPFPHQFKQIQRWLGEDAYLAGRRDGKVEVGSCAAGQSAGLITDVPSASDVAARIAAEASLCLERLSGGA